MSGKLLSSLPGTELAAAFSRAIRLAQKGPRSANPRVGALLILPSGDTVEGWHRGAGTPHAEADALDRARAAGHDPRGGIMIVTLEPCAHSGRTPSCARGLIDAGVTACLFAHADPTERAGGGADLLRADGITALTWVDAVAHTDHDRTPGDAAAAQSLTADAQRLNDRWMRAQAERRPFVTAKIAQTLDGFTAAPDGTSQWITSHEARAAGHRLRAHVDAIAVGTGTLIADDPRLSARTPAGDAVHQPLRVVIGQRPVPEGSAVIGADGRFVHLATRDLPAALTQLRREHGVEHLLIDGGPTLIGAALAADLIDDLWVHIEPTLLGAGRPSVLGLNPSTLTDRLDFDADAPEIHGTTVTIHARPRPAAPQADTAGTPDRKDA